MKTLISFAGLFLLLFFPLHSFPAIFPTTDSTANVRKPHKANPQQFLERYGTDDTSRALIRYYFQKRKANVKHIL